MENVEKLPMLGFGEAVKSCFGKLTNFNGRARRSELWWFILLYCIVELALGPVITDKIALMVIPIMRLFIFSVTVRRMHDRGHSGWWVLVSILISVYSSFYLAGSGILDELNTINPDPDKVLAIIYNPLFAVPNVVAFVVNIVILVFSLLDSDTKENKYGPSPKYIPVNQE